MLQSSGYADAATCSYAAS